MKIITSNMGREMTMCENYFIINNMMNSRSKRLRNLKIAFRRKIYNYPASKYNIFNLISWCRELTMKYVYSGGFDMKRCMERLKLHLHWRSDPTFQNLSFQAEDYLVILIIYNRERDLCIALVEMRSLDQ